MAMQDILDNLKNFDPEQLNDFDNVGNWPTAIKVLIWIIIFAACLFAGYYFHVTNLLTDLGKVTSQETELRADYEEKYNDSAHLEGYRQQQIQMEESFGVLLGQLPSDTEIPGLIEDITNVGIKSGLTFDSIKLEEEVTKEFYIEKPIEIVVRGGYHDLGKFVSDVADLARIVTLHDFTIEPFSAQGGGTPGSTLKMSITAKTYRYREQNE